MDTVSMPTKSPLAALFHNVKLFFPAVLLFAGLIGYNVWRLDNADKPLLGPNGLPINPAIEERFGVRITGIHIIGRNGLVDLRYRVLDAAKAKNFGHYTETSPLLIAEKSGRTVEVTIMGLHNHRVETGRTYYILYRNTANALQSGDLVTVQLDDLRLEHFPAQ